MTDRGTGRTTRQMLTAPQGAVFVWVNAHLPYPRSLAGHLGRRDLEIVDPGWIERGDAHGRKHIVVDHAAVLSEKQRDILNALGRDW